MSNNRTKAFTLIELSIVLVIIGLITGGVLVGSYLIKTASIQQQIRQFSELTSVVNGFRVKYDYLPGDMPPEQASSLGFFVFTGANAGKYVSSLCTFGNNDGAVGNNNEAYPFWSHLSSSGMVKGFYAGEAGNLLRSNSICGGGSAGGIPITSPTTTDDFAKFFPRGKIGGDNSFMFAVGNRYLAAANSNVVFGGIVKDNMFILSDLVNGTKLFSANEMFQIDVKIDDGFPFSGIFREYGTADYGSMTPTYNQPCTSASGLPVIYDLSASTADQKNCDGMIFFF